MTSRTSPTPTNSMVNSLLTDMYQITMAYAYWKSNKHDQHAVFDLFFRKAPFKGEFTVFAGLEESLKYIHSFSFTDEQIEWLSSSMGPSVDPKFFTYLKSISTKDITVYAVKEGTVVFPAEPLIRVEGPLAICQLLETTLLNLVNFATLMTTNATRFRLAAGPNANLLEFGLRRAQGPDGAMSASKYSYIGGFNGTSNCLAGMTFGMPVKGTHAHAFVQTFESLDVLTVKTLTSADGSRQVDFIAECQKSAAKIDKALSGNTSRNEGELAAFISYAIAFPSGFLALVDTYDTLASGVPNFLAVALALHELGYKPIGIRLDSGDLAYLSRQARALFKTIDSITELGTSATFTNLNIVASNDIDESILYALKDGEGHEINTFGIGTHLVTCKAQPALGAVYKLVEINHHPRIKLSNEMVKVSVPGKKEVYRIYVTGSKHPVLDVMVNLAQESAPKPGVKMLCRHPFIETKRAYVVPERVESLLSKVWDSNGLVTPIDKFDSPDTIRSFIRQQLQLFRSDVLRYKNPTPYKVSITDSLFKFMHDLWAKEAPIRELTQ